MIEDQIKRIEKICNEFPGSIEEEILHAIEEAGEVVGCLRGKKNDEPIENEIIDIWNCAIAALFRSGLSFEEIEPIMNKKISKWERQAKKYESTYSRP